MPELSASNFGPIDLYLYIKSLNVTRQDRKAILGEIFHRQKIRPYQRYLGGIWVENSSMVFILHCIRPFRRFSDPMFMDFTYFLPMFH